MKIDRYDTNFLPFISRFSTSGFLRSNDNRILVNVVNILFHFSVMRDSFKKIGVMRDRYSPFATLISLLVGWP